MHAVRCEFVVACVSSILFALVASKPLQILSQIKMTYLIPSVIVSRCGAPAQEEQHLVKEEQVGRLTHCCTQFIDMQQASLNKGPCRAARQNVASLPSFGVSLCSQPLRTGLGPQSRQMRGQRQSNLNVK